MDGKSSLLLETSKLDLDATYFLLLYISSRFRITANSINFAFYIINTYLPKKKPTDAQFYTLCRELQLSENLVPFLQEKYRKTIDTKIQVLFELLPSITATSILDIGTEKVEFLDSLEKAFPGSKVRGINIDSGFCHYEKNFSSQISDKRFSIYDGLNIPAKNGEYDLITLFSVIHHLPDDVFEKLAKELYRVCKKYLFLKDVDLVSKVAYNTYLIQHLVYDGILVEREKTDSFLSSTATFDRTKDILFQAGFIPVKDKYLNNFNNSYYLLFEKN